MCYMGHKECREDIKRMNATFFQRLKAFMLDYLLIFAYLIALFILNVFLIPSLQQFFQGSLVTAQIMGFLMVTLPVSIYFIISDSILGGQSFGKKKMGIKVINAKGQTLSVPHAIYRIILKFMPWELSHFLVYRLVKIGDGEVPIYYYFIGGLIYALMFAYILTPFFTKKKQALYDMAAKTQVVKVNVKPFAG